MKFEIARSQIKLMWGDDVCWIKVWWRRFNLNIVKFIFHFQTCFGISRNLRFSRGSKWFYGEWILVGRDGWDCSWKSRRSVRYDGESHLSVDKRNPDKIQVQKYERWVGWLYKIALLSWIQFHHWQMSSGIYWSMHAANMRATLCCSPSTSHLHLLGWLQVHNFLNIKFFTVNNFT